MAQVHWILIRALKASAHQIRSFAAKIALPLFSMRLCTSNVNFGHDLQHHWVIFLLLRLCPLNHVNFCVATGYSCCFVLFFHFWKVFYISFTISYIMNQQRASAILLLRRCRRQSRQGLHPVNCSQQELENSTHQWGIWKTVLITSTPIFTWMCQNPSNL